MFCIRHAFLQVAKKSYIHAIPFFFFFFFFSQFRVRLFLFIQLTGFLAQKTCEKSYRRPPVRQDFSSSDDGCRCQSRGSCLEPPDYRAVTVCPSVCLPVTVPEILHAVTHTRELRRREGFDWAALISRHLSGLKFNFMFSLPVKKRASGPIVIRRYENSRLEMYPSLSFCFWSHPCPEIFCDFF